jgi:hypothetical protein
MVNYDIVILSNGPGEVTTWVQPVVQELRQKLSSDMARISVILSPCPHSTGKESEILNSFSEVDRVLDAKDFWAFLLWGKTPDHWDWKKQGIVLFLGGDQFYTVILGKRLRYQTIIYTEWEARWYRFIDHFAVIKPEIIDKIPQKYQNKFTVVGDLIVDVKGDFSELDQGEEIIGLLPGSKAAKLTQGVPLSLAIADFIHQQRPETRFILPVAPTLELETLAKYADLSYNKIISKCGNITAKLIILQSEKTAYLETNSGLKIELITDFPALTNLSQCTLCLTTIGANTAQLGALAIPMIILLPTQQLDAMRAWDGLPGILANLPGIGTILAKLINWYMWQKTVKEGRLYAWPNLWAKQEIVPELMGNLEPEMVGKMVINYLENPEKLTNIRSQLIKYRGEAKAATKLAEIITNIARNGIIIPI